jgi:DNA-directed RNA polymerase subunit RPC12/RpoP
MGWAVAIGLVAGFVIGWIVYQNHARFVALLGGAVVAAVGLIWNLAGNANDFSKIGEAGIRDYCARRTPPFGYQYQSIEECRDDVLADATGAGMWFATLLLWLGVALLVGLAANWLYTRANQAGRPASPPASPPPSPPHSAPRPATGPPAGPPSTAPSRPPELTDSWRLDAPGRIPEQPVPGTAKATSTSKGTTCPNCSRTFKPKGFPKVRCPHCSTRFLAKRATSQ